MSSESRIWEIRPFGSMRGGKKLVIGRVPFNPSFPAYSTLMTNGSVRPPFVSGSTFPSGIPPAADRQVLDPFHPQGVCALSFAYFTLPVTFTPLRSKPGIDSVFVP